jgi:hypothetical protein
VDSRARVVAAVYGGGLTASNAGSILSFGVAYMAVVVIQPLVDLTVLAAAKAVSKMSAGLPLQRRLYCTGIVWVPETPRPLHRTSRQSG